MVAKGTLVMTIEIDIQLYEDLDIRRNSCGSNLKHEFPLPGRLVNKGGTIKSS